MKKITFCLMIVGCCFMMCCSKDDEPANTINGHEYVDLGLSVKWATCNVGANVPQDPGNFYSWASLTPNVSSNDWLPDNPISDISGTQYDVAHMDWGGSWRMPTYEELSELLSSCEFVWTSINGMNGCNVIGPNGNSIFLPAVGFGHHETNDQFGIEGYYWSSSRCEGDGAYNAYSIEFSENYKYRVGMNIPNLFSIRPVTN